MSTAEVEVTNIVDRGDVILVVGSGEDIVKLKVNSMFLRAASKTFEALLGPNYAEGQALSYDNPPELPLPEDDPSAMTTVCYCLHFKQHLVPENPDANQILEVAKAVDKYALQEALAVLVQAWLTLPTASTQFHDLGNTLRAALIIGNEPAVKKLTTSLILSGEGNYTSLLNEDDSESFVNITSSSINAFDFGGYWYKDSTRL
ncbi:hypothetical protein LTR05_002154 [Lithohypha guttulata]|uniref:BTB domain-containing protein n=1 Tax=Lithohypha guttulata TaxID=1690604 RepID=A0AAN7T3Q3_9EURO|nr:hypothetical protein LTR05_002154 [Lithohypha guttulata]